MLLGSRRWNQTSTCLSRLMGKTWHRRTLFPENRDSMMEVPNMLNEISWPRLERECGRGEFLHEMDPQNVGCERRLIQAPDYLQQELSDSRPEVSMTLIHLGSDKVIDCWRSLRPRGSACGNVEDTTWAPKCSECSWSNPCPCPCWFTSPLARRI